MMSLSCIDVVPEARHKVRSSKALEGGDVSAQMAFQGSSTETRKLLAGPRNDNILCNVESMSRP